MPAGLQAALDAVTLLFNALFAIIVGIVFPATPTPVSILAAFGIIIPLLLVSFGFFRRLTRGSGD